jgi:RNA polymerase-associated protein RTF1
LLIHVKLILASSDSYESANEAEEASLPYPLEGKYKDEADREHILGLSEVVRETILYEREEELNQLREKQQLQARLRQQKQQQQKQDKQQSIRRTARETATPQSSALSELKRKREAKSKRLDAEESTPRKRRAPSYSSDDDSEEEGALSDESDHDIRGRQKLTSRRGQAGKASGPPLTAEQRAEIQAKREQEDKEGSLPLEYKDATQIRVTRKQLIKFLYYPQFADTVRDCFLRIAVGQDREGKLMYRLCTVKSVGEASRPYRLPDGQLCNRTLECAHANAVRIFEMTYVSDTVFSEAEFDHWRQSMEKDKLPLVKKRKIKAKLRALEAMNAFQLTDKEISEMIAERNKLSAIPKNVALEKMRLQALLTEAKDGQDYARIDELASQLNKIEELTRDRRGNADLDKMSKLNLRNRQKTMASVSKAELGNADKRRAAEQSGQATGDPFSRLKTRPKTFYESSPATSVPGSPGASSSQQEMPAVTIVPAAKSGKKEGLPKGADGLIAEIEIDLEL